MSELNLMIFSMAASVTVSLSMWAWMKSALNALLDQLCDRGGSTEFWSRYTFLMLLIAPLSLAVIFSPSSTVGIADAIRQIVLAVLLGNLIGFALIGRSLLKAVRLKPFNLPKEVA